MKQNTNDAKLSIIIPVYNEKDTILKLLEKALDVDLKGIKKEIIIVDDCSTDGTRDILKKMNNENVKVFFNPKNMGKGSAIRAGLRHTTGELVIIQDADLEYNPEEYPRLLKPILDGETDIVYGSRFGKGHKARYRFYYTGNILLSLITSLLYGRRITDMETCYKLFRAEIIKNIKLRAERFDFEPEITAKLLKKGYKIKEVPISYRCRSFKEGKKISWLDGVKAVLYLIKYRFAD